MQSAPIIYFRLNWEWGWGSGAYRKACMISRAPLSQSNFFFWLLDWVYNRFGTFCFDLQGSAFASLSRHWSLPFITSNVWHPALSLFLYLLCPMARWCLAAAVRLGGRGPWNWPRHCLAFSSVSLLLKVGMTASLPMAKPEVSSGRGSHVTVKGADGPIQGPLLIPSKTVKKRSTGSKRQALLIV